jgi:hypothetical protein
MPVVHELSRYVRRRVFHLRLDADGVHGCKQLWRLHKLRGFLGGVRRFIVGVVQDQAVVRPALDHGRTGPGIVGV